MNAVPQATGFERGLAYLDRVRSLAPHPDLIDFVHDPGIRTPVCIWVGAHIDAVNGQLYQCLSACQDCFHPWQRPSVQILAAPLAQCFGIDGVCNLHIRPITILVDVGRVLPQDWLALVVHEYAHAYLGVPGHHADFGRILTHLCLALDLPSPSAFSPDDPRWRAFPPYRSLPDSLLFWSGGAPHSPSPLD